MNGPKVRKDGLCASCRRQRRLKVTNSQYPGLHLHLEADPFCSSSCANKWYGVNYDGQRSDAQMEAARIAAERHKKNKALHRTKEAA